MDGFLTSFAVVAIAEMGDKTQLLALVLAARFGKPWPVVWGILVATLANHALAALAGASVAHYLSGYWFQIAIGISFLAMGAWAIIPDKLDDDEGAAKTGASAFWTTLISFFLVEIGDKTQIATIALGAQFSNLFAVVAGTTLGMMAANAPVVIFGKKLIEKLPLDKARFIAAAIFIALGIWVIASTILDG